MDFVWGMVTGGIIALVAVTAGYYISEWMDR